MKGRFSDQPVREHGNPLKSVRTRDDLDKNLANGVVASFASLYNRGGQTFWTAGHFQKFGRRHGQHHTIRFFHFFCIFIELLGCCSVINYFSVLFFLCWFFGGFKMWPAGQDFGHPCSIILRSVHFSVRLGRHDENR